MRDFLKFKDFRYSEDYFITERFIILIRTIAKPQTVTCNPMKNNTLIILSTILILCIFYSCNKEKEFTKIIYNNYGGFDGPVYHLLLNNNKNFTLNRELIYKNGTTVFDFDYDSTKIGYFTGKISDEQMLEVKYGLSKISKKGYQYNNPESVSDIPHLNLTIFTENDTIIFETLHATEDFENNILKGLNKICETNKVVRIKPVIIK